MLNALALRCRDPGEFIASVVEHHRGFPLPRSEEEKTYLVFIGPQSEEDILEQIPGPGGEFTPQDGGEEAGGREEGDTEEEHQVVYGEEEREGEREEDGSQLFPVERWQPYRRIRIQYEVGESNEDTDGTHDVEEGYREYNRGDESSGDVSGYEEFLEQSSPSLGTPRGRLTGRRTTRSFGSGSGPAHEGRSEGPSEAITEELAQRFSRLPSNLGESGGVLDGVKGDGNGGIRVANRDGGVGSKSPSTSQELIEQFSQFIPFQKGNGGKPDDLGGNAEEKLYQTINDSQDGFDKAIQEDQENGPNDLIGDTEGAGFPTANEEPPQTPHLLESVSQGRGSRSPMSSPLSSPPPELEEEIGSREAMTEEEGQKGPSELSGEEGKNCQTDSMDVVKALSKAVYKGREESVELHGSGVQERYQAAGEILSQASPHRKFVLQVQEPGSPVRPRPDEISPLTSPLYPPSLHDASEGPIKPGDEGFTEFNEDETPLYPIPTLENLIATEHIDIVYVPDLETLQAFLESVMLSPVAPALNPPLLAIWGLVSAHYETDYFGGEGIGYTIAQAVEAAAKSGRLLVLGEGFIEVDYGDGGEVQEQCWMDVEVPLLNMGSMIVGRTVEVERILRNWCRFGDDLEYDEEDEGDEEGDEGEEKGYVKKGGEENERSNWNEESEESDEDEEDTEDGSDEEDDEDGGGGEGAESGENEEDEEGDESGEGEEGRAKGGG